MTGRPCDFSTIPAPGDWTDRAACKGRGDEFFAHYGGVTAHAVPQRLRELCESCPVFEDCLSYALSCDVVGIWAATSWRDRERMRGRRRRIA